MACCGKVGVLHSVGFIAELQAHLEREVRDLHEVCVQLPHGATLEVEVTALTMKSPSKAIAALEQCERVRGPSTHTAERVPAVMSKAIRPAADVLVEEKSFRHSV